MWSCMFVGVEDRGQQARICLLLPCGDWTQGIRFDSKIHLAALTYWIWYCERILILKLSFMIYDLCFARLTALLWPSIGKVGMKAPSTLESVTAAVFGTTNGHFSSGQHCAENTGSTWNISTLFHPWAGTNFSSFLIKENESPKWMSDLFKHSLGWLVSGRGTAPINHLQVPCPSVWPEDRNYYFVAVKWSVLGQLVIRIHFH